MQPPSSLPLMFLCSYYFLTVSLAFLFHVVLSFLPLPFPLLCLSNVSAQLLSPLLVCPWSTSPQLLPKTQHYNICSHRHLVRNLQVQQVLQPVDPQAIPGLVKTHLDSEGDKDGRAASASQPSELTQPSSTGNPPRGADPDLAFAGQVLSSRPHRVKDQGVSFHHCGCRCFVICLRQEEPSPPTNPAVFFFDWALILYIFVTLDFSLWNV